MDLQTIVLQPSNQDLFIQLYNQVKWWFTGTLIGTAVLVTTINYLMTNHILKHIISLIKNRLEKKNGRNKR